MQAVSKTLKHITPKQSNSLASQANNNAASIKKARPILFKEEENRIVEDWKMFHIFFDVLLVIYENFTFIQIYLIF